MVPGVASSRVTPLSLNSTGYRHYNKHTISYYYTCSYTPSLRQAAANVEGSSDDSFQGATAVVPHSVETTVISELVVTSTLLLSGDAEPETLPDGL